jgi:hypothetical protein
MFPYKFSVGEVAVCIATTPGSPFNNAECTVVRGLQWVERCRRCNGEVEHGGMMYGIEFAGELQRYRNPFNDMWVVFPEELRKKRPPEERTSTRRMSEIEA